MVPSIGTSVASTPPSLLATTTAAGPSRLSLSVRPRSRSRSPTAADRPSTGTPILRACAMPATTRRANDEPGGGDRPAGSGLAARGDGDGGPAPDARACQTGAEKERAPEASGHDARLRAEERLGVEAVGEAEGEVVERVDVLRRDTAGGPK